MRFFYALFVVLAYSNPSKNDGTQDSQYLENLIKYNTGRSYGMILEMEWALLIPLDIVLPMNTHMYFLHYLL